VPGDDRLPDVLRRGRLYVVERVPVAPDAIQHQLAFRRFVFVRRDCRRSLWERFPQVVKERHVEVVPAATVERVGVNSDEEVDGLSGLAELSGNLVSDRPAEAPTADVPPVPI